MRVLFHYACSWKSVTFSKAAIKGKEKKQMQSKGESIEKYGNVWRKVTKDIILHRLPGSRDILLVEIEETMRTGEKTRRLPRP